jgi:mono/diheme cytochrome c family protein
MATKFLRFAFLLAALVAFLAATSFAQTTQVKKEPVRMTSASSGSEMFNSYCAACHGKDAKGNGPAASALKNPPADLTQLAKKNNGKFPADHVANQLRSGIAGAHGSVDMPVWGPLFSAVSGHDDAIVQMRISNLVHYLESLQAK